MTDFTFEARIEDRSIVCAITPPVDLIAPIFCFSLMAPPVVTHGGTLLTHTGGYAEAQLPNLQAGQPHRIVLAYADPEFAPVNRAWLPLGAYLRVGNEVMELPALPAGVRVAQKDAPALPDGLRLVPPPQDWTPAQGTLQVDAFAYAENVHAPLLAGVETLAERLGQPAFCGEDGVPLDLALDDTLSAEAYQLTITDQGITLQAGDAAGMHYGAISLLMLRATHGGDLPLGRITDAPRFEWRGHHLDCARHFFQMGTLTRFLDLMALLKFNRFHWHFSDDEAFRLEVDCYPQIWQQTAYRGEGELVPAVFGAGPRAGGSYSKADAQSLIDHAKALHIEILPEIEVPAHALGLARAIPEMRDPMDTGRETSVQGYQQNVVNPAMPKTWEVFEALALEVADMFPLGILHLGCDELPERTWESSPAIKILSQREGLPTRDDIQEYTMRRLAGLLESHGIRPAAWEEAVRGQNGGVAHDTLVFSWTGQGPGVAAAKAGYDVVMSPAQNIYLDMAHTDDPDDWGAAWAAFVDLKDTIDWQVIPDPDIADRVKGIEGTFWSEFTTQDAELEPMIAPRILGVAMMGWSTEAAVAAVDLTGQAWAFGPVLDQMNWAWRRP